MGEKGQFRGVLWGVAIAVAASPMVLLFRKLGRPEFVRPAYFAVILIVVAVKVCWELRGRWWFWITILAISALHVPLIMYTAQRLTGAPFSVMLLFGFGDFALILAVVGLIEHLIGGKEEPVDTSPSSSR